MENSQSKILYLGFAVIMFIFLLGAALTHVDTAEKIQEAHSKKELERTNLIISTDAPADYGLYEDEAVEVYMGEKGSPVYKDITGDGDVVSKSAVYTDLINLPSTNIVQATVDGTVFAIGDPTQPVIDGHTNLSYQIKKGYQEDLYENFLKNKANTFIRTYVADDYGNIISVIYTPKIN